MTRTSNSAARIQPEGGPRPGSEQDSLGPSLLPPTSPMGHSPPPLPTHPQAPQDRRPGLQALWQPQERTFQTSCHREQDQPRPQGPSCALGNHYCAGSWRPSLRRGPPLSECWGNSSSLVPGRPKTSGQLGFVESAWPRRAPRARALPSHWGPLGIPFAQVGLRWASPGLPWLLPFTQPFPLIKSLHTYCHPVSWRTRPHTTTQ